MCWIFTTVVAMVSVLLARNTFNMADHKSFVQGFVIGGVIGVATALLMAPKAGEETRTLIQDKGIELKEKAAAAYADLQKKADEAFADLRGKVDELSVKVDQAIGRARQEDSQEATALPE